MSDTDPEHEAHDVDGPHDRRHVPGHTQAPVDLVYPRAGADQHERDGDAYGGHPSGRRVHRRDDLAIDLRVVLDVGESILGRGDIGVRTPLPLWRAPFRRSDDSHGYALRYAVAGA